MDCEAVRIGTARLKIERSGGRGQGCGMKRFLILSFAAGVMSVASGCKPSASVPAKATTLDQSIPTSAQPKLDTMKLWIGSQEMVAELAVTQTQEQTGMMFRTNMEENEGMLFVFPQPVKASFWMMHTFLPLSCAYITPDGTIQEIHDMTPQDTNEIIAATDNILYVLETKQGWFKRHNIGTGVVISSEHGPLHKVFSGQ
jgi:uncharacterized membrane protein (UPF0127 family)